MGGNAANGQLGLGNIGRQFGLLRLFHCFQTFANRWENLQL